MSSQVEETNSYSTLSKRSMIDKGYSKDRFISCFTSKKTSRAPLINLGYYIRTKIINHLVEQFVKAHALDRAQIVSFGAGFDTLYFRLTDDDLINFNFKYYEIDLKDVITQKRNFFQNSTLLSEKIRNDYHLINADLNNIEELESILIQSKMDFSIPTLLLAECSIIYMTSSSSNALIEWSSKTFSNAAMVVYEQVFPNTAFGQIMINHFTSLNTPLRSISENLNLSKQSRRYTNAGWDNCIVHTKWNVFHAITTVEERLEAFSRELFDEWEEIHMLCSHYSVSLATQGSLNVCPLLPRIETENEKELLHLNFSEISSEVNLQRFGHTVCQVASGSLFVAGGFGPISEKHRHERSKTAYIIKKSEWHPITLPSQCALMHSISLFDESEKRIFLLGGRQSPAKASSSISQFYLDKLSTSEYQSHESPKLSRWRFSAVEISRGSDTGCLIYGGITTGLNILDDAIYLPFNNCSKPIDLAKGPGSRFSHSATTDRSKQVVWLFGGLSTQFQPKNDLWRYDVKNNEWSELKINGPQPLPRHGHQSLVPSCGRRLVIVGGANCEPGNRQPGVTVFDLEALTCSEFTLSPERGITTQPLLLLNFAICPRSALDSNMSEENDDEICIIAGGANCFSFGTHFNKTFISFKVPSITKY